MQYINKLSIISFLLIALTACGFQLRGSMPMPTELSRLYLQTDSPYSAFTKQLKQYLTSNKVTLVDDPTAASVILKIISASSSQRLTSTGANSQTYTYNLVYTVVYQLFDNKGMSLQAPQTVISSRDYSVTSNQLLGDTNVQSSLINQMQREAIYQMIMQIRSPDTLKSIHQTQQ